MKRICTCLAAACLALSAHPEAMRTPDFRHLDSSAGFPQVAVSGFAQDSCGAMWISSSRSGLYRYDGYDVTHVLSTGVNDICSEGASIYLCTDEGVSRLGEDSTLFKGTFVQCCGKDSSGYITFVSYSGAVRYRPVSGETVRYAFDLPGDRLNTAACCGGAVYAGSLLGRLVRYTSDGMDTIKDFGRSIQHILPSEDGHGLWISTLGGGLVLYDTASGAGNRYLKGGNGPGLPSDMVLWTCYDAQSRLWIGTQNGGATYDTRTGAWMQFKSEFGAQGTLSRNTVRRIFRDSQGGMWLGTYFGGVNYHHPIRGRFSRLTKGDGVRHLNDEVVSSICEGYDGSIWIGTNKGGVNRYDPKAGTVRHYLLSGARGNPEMEFNDVKAILCDEDRRTVYIGAHANGLFRLDIPTGYLRHIASPNNVAKIRRESPDRMLVLTEENNSYGIDLRSGTYSHTDRWHESAPEQPLIPGRTTMSCLKDGRGRLWTGTDSGLYLYDPSDGTHRRFGREDGLASDFFMNGSCCLASDGKMYFGGIGGVSFFDPLQFGEEPPCPMPRLKRMDTDGKRRVSLTFTAPDYVAAGKDIFEYRLRGFDDNWYRADSDNRAVYSRLPAGRYTLDVRVSRDGAHWTVNEGAEVFRIPPPWYLSPLGLILELMLAVGIAVLAVRVSVKQKTIHNELKMKKLEDQYKSEIVKLKALRVLNSDLRIGAHATAPQEVKDIPKEDEKFLLKVTDTVEKNLANPDFTTESLAASLGISRVTLYKKISALTGEGTLAFIHKMRFLEACRLLEEGSLTVSEICYRVGFSNPSNFSTSFKKAVGCAPGDYRKVAS